MRTVLRSKIHRAWVTDNNPDYVGSVVIDRSLMKKADLWEFEKVLICNATNGERWETYVLPGPEGSGEVSVQGAGARLCMKGDCLIILAFETTDEPIEPKMILVDEHNHFAEYVSADQYAEQIH
ncbi:MAG TPA: aspartate 1-decarboxylase [Dehalococcoidia bacterium]|nr:aspartate 1-decarboxylase [Dehalococcoidia bacterium]